jgi:hypothetical protein
MKMKLIIRDVYGMEILCGEHELTIGKGYFASLNCTQATYLMAHGLTEEELADRNVWGGITFQVELSNVE